ncbi:hypothetical protein FHS18_001654 [Paenibacillus phyllosphaerae]|uniref:SLH domain-containing protein n=1 Tax=Paenibacillus phyllosphaerae TaxID=274593 RepID=A0A7W5AWL6_9BACL|nr:glycosyl hydrolase [Paenibacillus phyllosphaerae]MBB3109591.1 hypothetical protein [Paenibacillus phyllosphaerae]
MISMSVIASMVAANAPVTAMAEAQAAPLDGLAQEFALPGKQYRPKVRWWWPGGDVNKAELERELQLLSDNMFGGAEIMPNAGGMSNAERLNDQDPIHTYGDENYYANLKAALTKADELGLTIDLNMGTGWTAGGKDVPIEDNEWTFLVGRTEADKLLTSDSDLTRLTVPAAMKPSGYDTFAESNGDKGFAGGSFSVLNWDQVKDQQRLYKLFAAKVTAVNDVTMTLDQASVIDITGQVNVEVPGKVNNLADVLPIQDKERWVLIAVYTMPVGSNPVLTSMKRADKGYLVDPLNAEAIQAFYSAYLDELQNNGVLSYTVANGGALRAVFNDSFEFFTQRYVVPEAQLQEAYGDDFIQLLPAVLELGADQMFGRATNYFDFATDVDARINYDYNKAISSEFFNNWYAESISKLGDQGLILRQQGYNPPVDNIQSAGVSGILPETENLDENTLRKVSSGAHIYGNSNLVSAESFVFHPGGNYSLTPQTYKAGINKYMISGVNDIIYHGMAYQWNREGFSETGWSPFFSPKAAGSDIATNVSESDASFWPYFKDINTYAARAQYLVRQGDNDADVLLYMPSFGNADESLSAELSRQGFAWDLVNDDILAKAAYKNGSISVPGGSYRAIVVPSGVTLPVASAKALELLAQAGANIVLYGDKPSKQPGYYYEAGSYLDGDASVAKSMASITANPRNADELAAALQEAKGMISYEANDSLRMTRRALDGSSLAFIANTSNEEQAITVNIDPSLAQHVYLLDPLTGHVSRATMTNGQLKGYVQGEGAIAVIAGGSQLFSDARLTAAGNPIARAVTSSSNNEITSWTLDIKNDLFPDEQSSRTFINAANPLFDWSQRDEFKYLASNGYYTASINVDVSPAKPYVLKLGSIGAAAAEVKVNDGDYEKVIFAPYELDITDKLVTGTNTITVKIVPAYRNRLIGLAESTDATIAAAHKQLKGQKQLSAGLMGPVTLSNYEGRPTVQLTDAAAIPAWAKSAIAELLEKGIVSGGDNGAVDPTGSITRAEWVKWVVLGLGFKEEGASADFSDIDPASWYAPYVDIAAANNLINGDGKGHFSPNSSITRQDLAVILYEAVRQQAAVTSSAGNANFTDDNRISSYALEAVHGLSRLGIVNGRSDGSFDPLVHVTRAEAAVLLSRVMDYNS